MRGDTIIHKECKPLTYSHAALAVRMDLDVGKYTTT
jgi:hypothetical protein